MVSAETLRRSWRAWLGGDDRSSGAWWAGWAWTIVFAALCAIGFTVVSIAVNTHGDEASHLSAWLTWFQLNLATSLIVTLTIRMLFIVSALAIGRDRLSGWSRARRSLYFSLVPIVGVSIAWPLAASWVLGIDLGRQFSLAHPGPIVTSIGLGLLITAIFVQFFAGKARQIQAENRATEARLRLLQGQMQPHFLFNTLANVVSLMERDTPRAKAMLESFVDYLRASLSGLGDATHDVADEIALVEAYLRIIQVRMEDRLHYTIDVPEALRAMPLLPLTLQPLVENAIVHGLEPTLAGGHVRIGGGRDGGLLWLVVEDDGCGLPDEAAAHAAGTPGHLGSGTALANIRERLANAYETAASLRIEPVSPHGTRSRLTIPIDGGTRPLKP